MQRKQIFYQQISKILRFTFVQFIFASIFLVCLNARTVSAQEVLNKKITLSIEDQPLKNVLESIEKQALIRFTYSQEIINTKQKVIINVKDLNLKAVFEKLFNPLQIRYSIFNDKTIVLVKSKETISGDVNVLPISGRVTDRNEIPLIGVTIQIKETNVGSITDADGNFFIDCDLGATLIFSYTGYSTKEVLVASPKLNIILDESATLLEEIVVVGYGTQKKSDVTGAVVSLSKERLQQLPNTNIAQALQGSVTGLQINTNGGGAEGNNVSILIRGRNSISASNGPLIIWDGIPYEGGISEINPNDVESIEVLKDASAAAIYGSRGSNGVILITSKQGKKGKLNITYDGSLGTQSITNRPDLLTGEEFYNFKKTRLNAPNTISLGEQAVYDAGKGIDWYQLATQKGFRSQHSLSMTGGTDKISFYFGGTLLDVKGVSVNDQFKRYSLRPNLEVKVTPYLTIGTNTQFSLQNRDGIPVEFSDSRNTGGGANFFNPLTIPYDSNGNPAIYAYADYPPARNPLSNLLVNNKANSYRVFTTNNIKIDIPFIKGLSYKLNTGIEYESNQRKTYWGRDVALGFETNGYATNYTSTGKNFTVENIINYSKEFGKHSVNITALYSSQSNQFDRDQLEGQGFPNDVLTNYQMSSATLLTASSINFKQNLVSQMGRLNYGYDGKYLITLTTRRDGYSGFGTNNKFGIFPSGALGWNLHKESFMKRFDFISNLKLRMAYGLNGNQAVSSYSSLAKLSSFPYVSGTTVLPGYVPSALANQELGWESTKSLSGGIDFGLLNDRIQGSLDFYSSNTSNLLLNRTISSVQGFTRILQNIGKTANKGVELGLTSTNIRTKDFIWTTNLNLSHNKNKIVDLYGDGKDDVGNSWFIGSPINVIYGLQYDGVFKSQGEVDASVQKTAKPGWVRIKNINGDTIINTASDRTILGNEDPNFIWGITNTIKYKGISLMVFLHGVNGVTKRNPFDDDNVFTDVRRNTTKKDWWSPTNPDGNHFANDANANPLGLNFYESATFARIKDVSLAYELPPDILNRIKLASCKVYVTGRNLATFTKYKALDPELTDQFGLPLQKEIVFGLTVTL
jgi:TonB-linked SusC/RagA family outer membrane protein